MRAGARFASASAGPPLALLVLALLMGGCGGDGLWERWRAERELWQARRAVSRIEINPGNAVAADWARAEAACRRVTASFPAEVWSARSGAGAPLAFEVLEASGRAALLRAGLDEMRGRTETALGGYERAEGDYRAVPGIALEAAVARTRLLAQAGRAGQAEAEWEAITRRYAPVDPRSGELLEAVLDAPLHVARARLARGDARGADSLLRAAEAVYLRVLPGQRGRETAPALWARLSEARATRGDAAGARDALRQALGDPAAGARAPGLVLALARRALDAASPDSALAYARWAAEGFAGVARPAALLIAAQAWQARGAPDSALAVYERVIDEGAGGEDVAARARFARARLLEALGRWDQARGEYHALAGALPTHPLSLESMMRVVRYHLQRGERGLGLAEARHAVGALDALIANQQDDSVQVRAGETRARLLLETDDTRGGCGALAALLRRYPGAPLDAALLFGAAQSAETRLHDPDLAVELYRSAALRAGDPELQHRADAAAARLGGGRP